MIFWLSSCRARRAGATITRPALTQARWSAIMAQADHTPTTTIPFDAVDELDAIKDAAHALELSIAGFLHFHPDGDGPYGSALESQAMELTRRLDRLSEDIGGDRTEA
jgi:hypothetical protein